MSPAGLSVRSALDRYKAGIPTEDILALAAAEVLDPNLDLRGIHMHVGRHSDDPSVWSTAVASLGELLIRLRSQWDGWAPVELDVGGGFPAPRDPFGRLDPKRADAPEHAPPTAPTPTRSAPSSPRRSGGPRSTRRLFASRSSRDAACMRTSESTWRPWATSSASTSRPS